MAREDADRAALRDANWRMVLRLETSVSVGIGLLMLIIWALAGTRNFWPAWVWLGLAIPLALQVAIRRGRHAPKDHRQGRSNAAIAGKLVVTAKAVDKHINSIFMKLDLLLDADDNRRVLAVLRYLQTD